MVVPAVSAATIRDGYGASLIAGFVAWARSHGVRVIGGLPTQVDLARLPEATRAAMAAVYLARGGEFLTLANRSRYPIADFFDTPLHLNEACQIAHSIALARALAPLLGRTARAPPDRLTERSRRSGGRPGGRCATGMPGRGSRYGAGTGAALSSAQSPPWVVWHFDWAAPVAAASVSPQATLQSSCGESCRQAMAMNFAA